MSEIFVISDLDYTLSNSQYGVSHYYDMLAENAFGNYRDLLEKVTLHPTMGIYLSMVRNQKANPVLNIRQDENYAREVLQLFSIGLKKFNLRDEALPLNNPRTTLFTRYHRKLCTSIYGLVHAVCLKEDNYSARLRLAMHHHSSTLYPAQLRILG